jgi:ectoine hydroxylase-related dioxygenase (phytanoyl-CoA dioxygenase family)
MQLLDSLQPKLASSGYAVFQPNLPESLLHEIRTSAFATGEAGVRCLLDEPCIRKTACATREALVAYHLMPAGAKAVQAIAFDKTPGTNWKVTWHQDVMFPFARPVSHAGFELSSKKADIDYARPPQSVLETMLAVRIHLDDCDETNGPLRVSPGTHQLGILRSPEIPRCLERHGEQVCCATTGEALLLRPLLLHASSPATVPNHRRVLHLVFHHGPPIAEVWHRSL